MRDLSSKKELLEILEENGGRLTSQMVESATSGNIRFVDSDQFLRRGVVGGSTRQLIDSSTVIVDGESTFDGTRFAPDRVEIIDKIKIGYDNDSATGKQGGLTYQKALPAIYRNASLQVSQDGKLLGNYPLFRLGNKYAGNSVEDDYRVLKHPIVLVGGLDYKFELVFPKDAVSTATNNEYLELATSGVSVYRTER